MKKDSVHIQFAELLSRADSDIELDRAALLIAAEEYPGLRMADYFRRLDSLALLAGERVAGGRDPEAAAQALAELLFGELGWQGNFLDYFDVRNSFLNEVIDRRLGIPITLSVLMIEVGRRAGFEIAGVGMPGHFLVRCAGGQGEVFWDPFNGGRRLAVDDCRAIFERMYAGSIPFHDTFLLAVSKRQIVARMLQNLKGIYARARDHHKTLGVIERLLIISPDDPAEIRDRGLCLAALGRYSEARADLESYLGLLPDAADAATIREKIVQLRRNQARLN